MQLGAPAAPPKGYLEFCERQPRDCQVSHEAALAQSGIGGDAGQAATAAIARPSSSMTEVKPALARLTSSMGFRFAADTTERVNWLSLASNISPETVTPVGQARLSFATFRFETPATPTPAPALAAAAPSRGATLVMDSRTWSTVTRVNAKVNRGIIRKTDFDNHGVEERWSTPLEEGAKFGDCEDYVLEKRRALIAEGFPPGALSIAVVLTAWNTTHAVLLVAGDKGEYVLDNLSPWVVPWNEAPYSFRKRQVAGDAFRWARVESQAPAGEHARPLLIASAD